MGGEQAAAPSSACATQVIPQPRQQGGAYEKLQVDHHKAAGAAVALVQPAARVHRCRRSVPLPSSLIVWEEPRVVVGLDVKPSGGGVVIVSSRSCGVYV